MKPAVPIAVMAGMLVSALIFGATHWLKPDENVSTTVHMAGDSTMSEKLTSKRPGTGWGEPFARMLCDGIRIVNHAQNGRSTKSFLSEGLWKNLLGQLQQGDIVLIQFGHNDQKSDEARLFAGAQQDYKMNLQSFVNDVRTKDAVPVLLSSIVRRAFDSQGTLLPTLGDYPAVTREVAVAMSVQLVDLNTSTRELVESLGPEVSKDLFIHLAPGVNDNYPQGIQDDTHLSSYGALEVAKMVAIELKKSLPEVICPAI